MVSMNSLFEDEDFLVGWCKFEINLRPGQLTQGIKTSSFNCVNTETVNWIEVLDEHIDDLRKIFPTVISTGCRTSVTTWIKVSTDLLPENVYKVLHGLDEIKYYEYGTYDNKQIMSMKNYNATIDVGIIQSVSFELFS